MNKILDVLAPKTQNKDSRHHLQNIFEEAEKEYQKLEETFEVMGWHSLPDRLKIEIKDDVTAMINELEGRYSTCDPFVVERRKSITYWIEMYQCGVCSLET